MRHVGAETLENAKQLVFGRSFEGLKGDDANYFEISQEYAHLAGIHWRSEQRAYCRFDERGDFDPVVSITAGEGRQRVTLVSFKRQPLECYLLASNSALVRMFDFTCFDLTVSLAGLTVPNSSFTTARSSFIGRRSRLGSPAILEVPKLFILPIREMPLSQ